MAYGLCRDAVAYDLCGGTVAYGMVACGATLVAVPVASLAWVAPAAPRLTVLITACAYNLELLYEQQGNTATELRDVRTMYQKDSSL